MGACATWRQLFLLQCWERIVWAVSAAHKYFNYLLPARSKCPLRLRCYFKLAYVSNIAASQEIVAMLFFMIAVGVIDNISVSFDDRSNLLINITRLRYLTSVFAPNVSENLYDACNGCICQSVRFLAPWMQPIVQHIQEQLYLFCDHVSPKFALPSKTSKVVHVASSCQQYWTEKLSR